MLQNDYEAFESFMEWLEDNNYCRVVPCAHCSRWNPDEWLLDGYCTVNKCFKHFDDWCSDSEERNIYDREVKCKHGRK